MLNYPSCSLITPTYNWPEALELLLLSIKAQSYLPNEVIIADDGSGKETETLIKRMQIDFPVPLVHIWHEDIINRKPAIMNKAIAAAKHEYMIEIDGDIIMHRHFVKDHLDMAKKGLFLYGSRVTIKKDLLENLFENKQITFNVFSKGIKKRVAQFAFPYFQNYIKKKIKDLIN